MFDEIEGNVDGIIPLENVVQYLTIMSQDNRKIKVKVIIGSLLEDYKDVQIDLKKFTVKIKKNMKEDSLKSLAGYYWELDGEWLEALQ